MDLTYLRGGRWCVDSRTKLDGGIGKAGVQECAETRI